MDDPAPTSPLEDALLACVRSLPEEQQTEVLRFAEALAELRAVRTSGGTLAGILEGRGYHVTENDITETRREMWGNFPRPIPD